MKNISSFPYTEEIFLSVRPSWYLSVSQFCCQFYLPADCSQCTLHLKILHKDTTIVHFLKDYYKNSFCVGSVGIVAGCGLAARKTEIHFTEQRTIFPPPNYLEPQLEPRPLLNEIRGSFLVHEANRGLEIPRLSPLGAKCKEYVDLRPPTPPNPP